jgi:uncharacterized protein YbaP (TraB family)
MNVAHRQTGRSRLARRVLALLCVSLCLYTVTWTGRIQAGADSALFWTISKGGEHKGYLLGTIHSEDPWVLDFPAAFIEKLNTNEVFAMEMVPDLPTIQRLTDYMHYQDGSTLESKIGPKRYARFQTIISKYRVPPDWVVRMKVWAAMMTLSVPPPETGFFMDFSLSLRAAGAGLKVIGLETLEEQLSFLEDMPMDQQLKLLDQALLEHDLVEEIHLQMVDSYLVGDLVALNAQAEDQLNLLEPAAKAYFMEQGIDARNRRMLESLLPELESKRVFVAIGALHLPGKSGLIELLRKEGFDLKPLPPPFSAETSASSPGSGQRQGN